MKRIYIGNENIEDNNNSLKIKYNLWLYKVDIIDKLMKYKLLVDKMKWEICFISIHVMEKDGLIWSYNHIGLNKCDNKCNIR